MAGLRIGLLGGLRLEIDRASLLLPQAARSLFSYLAAYPGRRATRDWLIGTFWPEHDETAARKRLQAAEEGVDLSDLEEDDAPADDE